MSTIAFEFVFDVYGRLLCLHLNRLHLKTLKALMCTPRLDMDQGISKLVLTSYLNNIYIHFIINYCFNVYFILGCG